MEIREDDLTGPAIRSLLERHLEHMLEVTPPESAHAMDVDRLKGDDITFWSAWDEDELLGCGALKELSRESGEVKSMRTAESALRRGVGSTVLTHIIQVAKDRGYRRLLLETGRMDAFAPARTLYERFGFVECGPFAEYVEDPNTIFMELDLGAAKKSPFRTALKWGERFLFVLLLVFVLNRVGPQFGALLGVGPDLGRAPDYALVTLDGGAIDSDALLGHVVVLNFWATWCGPCKLEMPALQSLHEDFESEGVVVLGLATDVSRGPHVADFLEEREITYPVGYATNAHRQAFGGVSMIPTTYVIDRAGVVQHKVIGYFAPPAMRAAVNRLLRAPESQEATDG